MIEQQIYIFFSFDFSSVHCIVVLQSFPKQAPGPFHAFLKTKISLQSMELDETKHETKKSDSYRDHFFSRPH